MPIQSYNPYTQQVLQTFDADTTDVINQKLETSSLAFKSWKNLDIKDRIKLFQELVKVFEGQKMNLAKLITLEVGVPIKQAAGQIDKCISGINHYCKEIENILKPEVVNIEGQKSEVRFAPLGIIFSIMPWNFPFWQVMRVATPVIISGNVYAVKHASNVPQCSIALEKCFIQAGFPVGIFTNFLVSGSDSMQIVADERVKGVSLTGSTAVGRQVASVCGQKVKPCVMELGGSDPFIVLNDADLGKVIPAAILSRFRNAGQSCNAAKRFIIQKEIYPQFVELFVKAVENMRVLDPMDLLCDIGPVVNLSAIEELTNQVNKSVTMGAKVLTGGTTLTPDSLVFMPTVLTNITKDMPVYTDEIFGPVASVIQVNTVEKAIEIANDTEYGLGASLWTADMELADKLADKLEAGNVFVNTMLTSDPRLPYGGIKNSGFGRELSHYGVKAFMNIKTVVMK
jgi:succinate-semialdehyde dehydrogenase / glutarate-semialdehyde dehydrogenase